MFFFRYWQYFFYAFVMLLPLQTVLLLRVPMIGGEKWQYGTIGVYGTDVLLFGALVCALWAKRFAWQSLVPAIRKQPWFFVLLFWIPLSVLWAPDTLLAGYSALKILEALLVFWFARSLNGRETQIIFLLLFVGAVFESLLGITQFLTQSTFISTWLGMSGHEAWQAGTSVLKLDSGRWLRAYGTLPHPNILGGYLATVLVICVSFFLQRRRRAWWNIFSIGGMMIIFLGLLVTFSRTAWMGTILGLAGVTFLVWRIGGREMKKMLLQLLLLFGLAGGVYGGILHAEILPRFDGEVIAREASAVDRGILMSQAWALFQTYPIIGVGAGNYTAVLMEHYPGLPVYVAQPVHNVLMLFITEFGVVGVVLFCSWIIHGWFHRGVKNERKQWAFQSDVRIAILFVLVPSFLVDHWAYTSHFGLFFCALVYGAIFRKVD